MSLARYIDACLPDSYTILGVRLKSLCLAHVFLMKKENCKYASDDEDATASIDDLLLAISICSRTYEEYLEFIEGAHVHKWFSDWGKYVQNQIDTDPLFNMFEKFELFNKYRRAGMRVPPIWDVDSNGDSSGVHWSQAVLQVLMSKLGYTESQAYNMPLAKALYECFQCLGVEFMTDEQLTEAVEKQGGAVCLT
jgi:hypothetical protein